MPSAVILHSMLAVAVLVVIMLVTNTHHRAEQVAVQPELAML
jgi:hypothetical protein